MAIAASGSGVVGGGSSLHIPCWLPLPLARGTHTFPIRHHIIAMKNISRGDGGGGGAARRRWWRAHLLKWWRDKQKAGISCLATNAPKTLSTTQHALARLIISVRQRLRIICSLSNGK